MKYFSNAKYWGNKLFHSNLIDQLERSDPAWQVLYLITTVWIMCPLLSGMQNTLDRRLYFSCKTTSLPYSMVVFNERHRWHQNDCRMQVCKSLACRELDCAPVLLGWGEEEEGGKSPTVWLNKSYLNLAFMSGVNQLLLSRYHVGKTVGEEGSRALAPPTLIAG